MTSVMEHTADTSITTIASITDAFRRFLHQYHDPTGTTSTSTLSSSNLSSNYSAHSDGLTTTTDLAKYIKQAIEMARTQTTTMYIDYRHLDPEDDQTELHGDDLIDDRMNVHHLDDENNHNQIHKKSQHQRRFFSKEQLEWLLHYYYTVEPHLCVVLRSFLNDVVPEYVPKDDQRNFSVSIFGFRNQLTVRHLQPELVGRLVAIRAMATKSTKVSPEVSIGTFQCRDCHAIIKNIKQDFKITLPTQCITAECSNKRFFDILPQYSTFTDWQQLTVQESTEHLPAGSVPRTAKVILRGELVEVAKPGDQCIITGVLISIPDVAQLYSRTEFRPNDFRDTSENPKVKGLKDLGVREMSYKTALLASNVTRLSGTGATPYPDKLVAQLDGMTNYQAGLHSFMQEDIAAIRAIKSKPNLAQVLVNSIAPNVYGHDLVKKGILFMILGGVHKVTKDRTSLRGDINVLLIGDPSTAKSQFLQFVTDFMPRVVYTSGKSSTAAGLTASVTRDSDTGEFVIEAGALMLADNGVCCIDEFDKMDQKDQSAIHEAMEQQTISIAKAGIQATLNARTSILAAANPLSGRYDTTRTLKQNVNITPPIMSRFDLYFILVDQPNADNDRSIAKHMIASHVTKVLNTRRSALGNLVESDTNTDLNQYLATVSSKQSTHEFLPNQQLRAYIRYARQFDPQLSDGARELIIKTYGDLRQRDLLGNTASSYKVTVRQLESLIRLSQACARMYLDTEVTEKHVLEAAELLNRSIVNVKPSSSLVKFRFDEGGDGDDDDDGDNDDGDLKSSNDPSPNNNLDSIKRDQNDDSEDAVENTQSNPRKRDRGAVNTKERSFESKQKAEAKHATLQKQLQETETKLKAIQEATPKHQITVEDYTRICTAVIFHLRMLYDEKMGELLAKYAAENNHSLLNGEIPQEEIHKIHSSNPHVISPVDLLNWLMQSGMLNQHAEAKYHDKIEEARLSDKKSGTTEAVDTFMNEKFNKYLKKVYKLVLRRMMNEDRSIVNVNGSIQVHPDYSPQQSVHDAAVNHTNSKQRTEMGISEFLDEPQSTGKNSVQQLQHEITKLRAQVKQTESQLHKANVKSYLSNRAQLHNDDDDDDDNADADDHDASQIPSKPRPKLIKKSNITTASQTDALVDDDEDLSTISQRKKSSLPQQQLIQDSDDDGIEIDLKLKQIQEAKPSSDHLDSQELNPQSSKKKSPKTKRGKQQQMDDISE